MNDLKLEVYAGKYKLTPIRLMKYVVESNQIIENKFREIRNACNKISRNNNYMAVFDNDNCIYTIESIKNMPEFDILSVNFNEIVELPIIGNEKVYEKVVEYYIRQNLKKVKISQKYSKYSMKKKSEILSNYIKNANGEYVIIQNQKKSIKLNRKFILNVTVKEDGTVYLGINSSSEFLSKYTIDDFIKDGKSINGIDVINDWSADKQSGKVVKVSEKTVTDSLSWGCSLKEHYKKINQYDRVKDVPDDTNIIEVKMLNGNVLSFYPQALKPIITREYIAKNDPGFSKLIEKYIKLNMKNRVELDKDLINDIGSIGELNGLEFNLNCCNIEELGFKKGKLDGPDLICGNKKVIKSNQVNQVFKNGFYSTPKEKIKIGYLYPEGKMNLLKETCNAIYKFCVLGQYKNENHKFSKYILKGLLNLDMNPKNSICEEYNVNNITDYKRAAYKLRERDDIDLLIAIVPNENDEDENAYNPFKTVWAEMNIPSQMISMKTATLFEKEGMTGDDSYYILQNIILGILGKIGGVPWIIKEMRGNVDCFVGLDVATIGKGIHYPACAVIFDKYGKLINFYRPKFAQEGEKISHKILQEIFDNVLISYEQKYGKKIENLVIHRDGFNNEDIEWYKEYFKKQQIKFSIIEVRKNIRKKMLYIKDGEITNPDAGHCIYNNNMAYMVTTNIKDYIGSPNPILIKKSYGDINFIDVLFQIFYLTQLHVGSIQNLRLPITTGYADKICKNIDYVPQGILEDKLFFL